MTVFSFIIAGLILVLTIFTWRYITQLQEQEKATLFERESDAVVSFVEDSLSDLISVGETYSALFSASEKVTREEFAMVYEELIRTAHPSVLAVGYGQSVTTDQGLESLIGKINSDTALVPEGTQAVTVYPESGKPDKVPVALVEPLNEFNYILGFDSLASTERADTIERARDTGEFGFSQALPLATKDSQPGLLLYVPIYANQQLDDVEERRARFLGVVIIVVDSDTFFAGLREIGAGVHTQVTTAGQGGQEQIAYPYPDGIQKNPSRSAVHSIPLAQQVFVVHVTASDDFASSSVRMITPLAILGLGVVVSALSLLALLSLVNARKNAAQLAGKMTQEIKASRDTFELLLESLPDPAVVINRFGIIRRVNKKAVEDSGLKRDELQGKPFSKVGVVAPSSLPKVLKNFAITVAGGTHAPYEVEMKTRGDTLRTYEINSQPLKGLVEGGGVQVVFRDVTERKRSAEQLAKQKGELERINKFMVGRELNLEKLKKENKELKQQLRDRE